MARTPESIRKGEPYQRFLKWRKLGSTIKLLWELHYEINRCGGYRSQTNSDFAEEALQLLVNDILIGFVD